MTTRPTLFSLDRDAIEGGLADAAEALRVHPHAQTLCDWMGWVLADACEGTRAQEDLSLEEMAGRMSAWLVDATWAIARVMAPPSRGPVLAQSLRAVRRAPDEALRPGVLLDLVRLGLLGGEDATRRAAQIASGRSGEDAVESLVAAAALLPPSEANAWLDEALTRAASLRSDELVRVAGRAFSGLGAERATRLYEKIQAQGGAPREWLVALAPRLPVEVLSGALGLVLACAAEGTVIVEGEARRALLDHLDAAQCLAWIEVAAVHEAVALVERLAALGEREQALTVFDRRFSEPMVRAEARLAACGVGPGTPGPDLAFVRDALEPLPAARWAGIVKHYPRSVETFFDAAEILARLAPLQDVMGIEARAALAPFVGVPLQRRLLRDAVALQRDAGDRDTLAALASCARWIEVDEAISLLLLELPAGSLDELLRAHGLLYWTAPLLHRAVGDEGLVAIARLLADGLLGETLGFM
ncbi:hypothetical protein [Sorangium sp. So ce1182]|uniref:hypothetical protein n=1 Tax=Sorangium sp. So ce1182 TaxID=3133334 RepID=UPI003F5E10CE